jgi:hypothetical protein
MTEKVNRNRGFHIIAGPDEVAFVGVAPPVLVAALAFAVAVVGELTGAADDADTNGDASVESCRGPYSDGTTTTMLSKSNTV